MKQYKKTLLIIGGGFAGFTLITKLYSQYHIILLDTKSYFEFTPSLPQLLLHPEALYDLTIQFKQSKFPIQYVQATLTHIEDNIAYHNKGQIEFDECIICIGSNYTQPIKSLSQKISDRFIELKTNYEEIKNSQTILIIGGGTVGIEIACEIKAQYKSKTVALITKNNILSTMSKSIQDYVRNRILNLGIELQENYKGPNLEKCFDIVYDCKGNKYQSVKLDENYEMYESSKQYLVDDYLQIRIKPNIYSAGDICLSSQNETKTAFAAEMQAEVIAYNLLHPNKKIKQYWIPNTYIISLGGYKALFIFETFSFGGFIPYLMKLFIEIIVINDFRGLIGFHTLHQIMNYIVYLMLYIYMIFQLLFAIAPLGSRIKPQQKQELKRIQMEIDEFKKQ